MEDALYQEDKHFLCKVYNIMFPEEKLSEDRLSHIICKYSYLYIGDQKYGSMFERGGLRSASLMASWANMDGEIDPENVPLRPGVVSHYISHKLFVRKNSKVSTFVFAIVQWNKFPLSTSSRQVWKDGQYFTGGPSTYLPVQRIHCKVVAGLPKTNNNIYLTACPVARKVLN